MKNTLQYIGAIACLAVGAALPAQAVAIELSPTNTAWAGQGMCSAAFTFDNGALGDTVKNLRVGISAIDQAGNSVDTIVLEVYEFGGSNAERYATALWESELACDASLSLVVTSANAVINEQRQDLLKNNVLTVRDFKPFTMRLANEAAGKNTAPQPYTNAEGVTCDYPLSEEDAHEIWQKMQSNPNEYIKQCTDSLSQIAMQYGGMSETEAKQHAKNFCTVEVEETKVCMAQPGLVPQLCLCGGDV